MPWIFRAARATSDLTGRLGLALALICCSSGCDERTAPPPVTPSQQSVEQAWQRANQVARQAVEAEQQVRHVRRLRDIDRVRYEAEAAEWRAQLSVMRGLLVGIAALLVATMAWLAVEIRRRRVLSAVLHDTLEPKGDLTLIENESPRSPY